MDPTYPTIDSMQFTICDWSKFYRDDEEPIPPNAPEAVEEVVDLGMFLIATMQETNVHKDCKTNF